MALKEALVFRTFLGIPTRERLPLGYRPGREFCLFSTLPDP